MKSVFRKYRRDFIRAQILQKFGNISKKIRKIVKKIFEQNFESHERKKDGTLVAQHKS